jgi:hypothetical protein
MGRKQETVEALAESFDVSCFELALDPEDPEIIEALAYLMVHYAKNGYQIAGRLHKAMLKEDAEDWAAECGEYLVQLSGIEAGRGN